MGVLNLFFQKLDAVINSLPTMTRIKCIGDCYMCAGGIFMEVNQPIVHATEAVAFGLRALDELEAVNREMDQKLRIRVGINTGGPIVGGVIGCGKPTFEILGPAINMAQQMEHHGIPLQIQISRSVYELIYGNSFKVRERGQIEIKNGSVVTYLVSR
jgi:class 3 adenylate cyclase